MPPPWLDGLRHGRGDTLNLPQGRRVTIPIKNLARLLNLIHNSTHASNAFMTTKDRRQREFAQREQLFLAKAWELIRRDGLLNLQMTRIAEECDYATGTLYQHFASKEDLLVALMTDGVRLRVELFERAGQWRAKSRERMFAIAVADAIFVQRNPEHFRIEQFALTEVVWGAASAERREAHFAAARPLGNTVRSIVCDAVAAGDLDLKGQTPEEVCVGLWALALGVHELAHAEGVLDLYQVRSPYVLMGRHMQHMLNGMGWKPRFDAGDAVALDNKVTVLKKEVFRELCPAKAAARATSGSKAR